VESWSSLSAMKISRAGRLALTLFLALYGFALLRSPEAGSLMDSVDLPIHETGHLVFSPFGEFVQFLGGTLFQVIVPCVFVGYFLKRKARRAASVAWWWVALRFWNLSGSVTDARAEELPLVGGGEHDWAYLLGRLGWLPYDQIIGRRVWVLGVLIYLVAIAGGLMTLASGPVANDEPGDASTKTVSGSTGGL
jgi:hypothetical protein